MNLKETPFDSDNTIDGLHKKCNELKAQLEQAQCERDEARAACAEMRKTLLELKVRIAYIGMAQESFWVSDEGCKVPDWRKHIALLEHALSNDCGKGWRYRWDLSNQSANSKLSRGLIAILAYLHHQ